MLNIDKHIDDVVYANLMYTKMAYVIWYAERRVGIITHCLLWDKLPFMNLLFVKEEYRGRQIGKNAVLVWEEEMKKQGYKMILLSTQADEGAQHLYRKLGYIDCGGLLFHDTPFEQPMEIFFRKVL